MLNDHKLFKISENHLLNNKLNTHHHKLITILLYNCRYRWKAYPSIYLSIKRDKVRLPQVSKRLLLLKKLDGYPIIREEEDQDDEDAGAGNGDSDSSDLEEIS